MEFPFHHLSVLHGGEKFVQTTAVALPPFLHFFSLICPPSLFVFHMGINVPKSQAAPWVAPPCGLPDKSDRFTSWLARLSSHLLLLLPPSSSSSSDAFHLALPCLPPPVRLAHAYSERCVLMCACSRTLSLPLLALSFIHRSLSQTSHNHHPCHVVLFIFRTTIHQTTFI